MDNDTEKKVIPKKNYVIVVVMFVALVILVIYLCSLYRVYDEHQREIPVIRGTLSEILPDELDHYIMENPTTVIYMCTASDSVCRDYEKNFKKLITKDDLQESIIYLNLSDVDQEQFIDTFNSTYPYKNSLEKHYPALVSFEDGEIEGILQGNSNHELTVSQTEQFIDMHQIKKQGEQ